MAKLVVDGEQDFSQRLKLQASCTKSLPNVYIVRFKLSSLPLSRQLDPSIGYLPRYRCSISCIALPGFSAYSGYLGYQLHSIQADIINDAMLASTQCADIAANFNPTSVTATTMVSRLQLLGI